VTDPQTTPQFDEDLRHALRAYASEGVRPFDPALVSAQARSSRVGARLSWWPRTASPSIQGRAVRLALVAGLLVVAAGAIAVVGSRLTTPAPPIPGVIAVAGIDRILVVDASARTARAITPETPHDASPVWSPDGTRMAISQHDGRGQLQLIDADGSNRHPIVGDWTGDGPVAWSPDGSRIAFSGYRYPGGRERGLYLVGTDGTGLTLLVPGMDGLPTRLAWSSDGSMIAFAASDPQRPVNALRGYVYVVDVASRRVTPVSSAHVEPLEDGPLAWRPGSLDLLYAQQRPEFGVLRNQDVVLAEHVGDTWQERPLVTDMLRGNPMPMWLDAEHFVYVRDARLRVAGVDGRPELAIGPSVLPELGVGCVAPDGSAIAMVSSGSEASGDDVFLIVPTDGGPTVPIDAGGLAPWGPCSWQAMRP
jgi:hypothetical protein